jgi:hypothetical protein
MSGQLVAPPKRVVRAGGAAFSGGRSRIVLVLFGTLVVTAGLAPSAAAAPPTPNAPNAIASDPQLIDNQKPAVLAEMRRQSRLAPAAAVLDEAVRRLNADSGYAGIGYGSAGVELYFKGSLPDEIVAALGKARTMSPVSVREAAYSHSELVRVQDEITAAVDRDQGEVQAIGVADDGSGIVVERMAATTASNLRAALAKKGSRPRAPTRYSRSSLPRSRYEWSTRGGRSS